MVIPGIMAKSYSVIFGLTADPVHKGHEQAIINGTEFLRLQGFTIEQFLLVPVYQPNLIADKKIPVASFEHRLALCEIVAQRLSKQLACNIKVSCIEKDITLKTEQKNYSVNTIKQLKLNNALFMVSADHFGGRWPKFIKWYKWQELLQYSGLLINQRPGHKINQIFLEKLKLINPNILLIEKALNIDTSSSQIRTGVGVDENLSSDILQYVHDHQLYQNIPKN